MLYNDYGFLPEVNCKDTELIITEQKNVIIKKVPENGNRFVVASDDDCSSLDIIINKVAVTVTRRRIFLMFRNIVTFIIYVFPS